MKNKALGGGQNGALRQETRLLITTFIIFELGYLLRFGADLIPSFTGYESFTIVVSLFPLEFKTIEVKRFPFYWFVCEDASYIFEGLSYLSLLLFHYKNFLSADR